MNPMTLDVYIWPLQPKELALTHPGQHGGEEQRLERLLLRLEQAPDLLQGEDVHLGLLSAWKLDVLHRVRVEVTPLDCVLGHLLENQDHVADRLGGQAFAQEHLDELANMGQADVPELHGPEE